MGLIPYSFTLSINKKKKKEFQLAVFAYFSLNFSALCEAATGKSARLDLT